MFYITNKYLGDSDRASRFYLSRQMERYGLGKNLFIFFVAIARNPGASQADICRVTLFDKAIVARSVAKLEALGYVARRYYEGDRKTSHLFLTEKGTDIFDEVQAFVSDWNEQIARDVGMDPGELEALAKKISDATRRRVSALSGLDCAPED